MSDCRASGAVVFMERKVNELEAERKKMREDLSKMVTKQKEMMAELAAKEHDMVTKLAEKEREMKTKQKEMQTKLAEKDEEMQTRLAEKEKEMQTRLAEKDEEMKTKLALKDGEMQTRLAEKEKEMETKLAEKDEEMQQEARYLRIDETTIRELIWNNFPSDDVVSSAFQRAPSVSGSQQSYSSRPPLAPSGRSSKGSVGARSQAAASTSSVSGLSISGSRTSAASAASAASSAAKTTPSTSEIATAAAAPAMATTTASLTSAAVVLLGTTAVETATGDAAVAQNAVETSAAASQTAAEPQLTSQGVLPKESDPSSGMSVGKRSKAPSKASFDMNNVIIEKGVRDALGVDCEALSKEVFRIIHAARESLKVLRELQRKFTNPSFLHLPELDERRQMQPFLTVVLDMILETVDLKIWKGCTIPRPSVRLGDGFVDLVACPAALEKANTLSQEDAFLVFEVKKLDAHAQCGQSLFYLSTLSKHTSPEKSFRAVVSTNLATWSFSLCNEPQVGDKNWHVYQDSTDNAVEAARILSLLAAWHPRFDLNATAGNKRSHSDSVGTSSCDDSEGVRNRMQHCSSESRVTTLNTRRKVSELELGTSTPSQWVVDWCDVHFHSHKKAKNEFLPLIS